MNIDNAILLAFPLIFTSEGCKTRAWLDTLPARPVWTIGHGATWVGGKPVYAGMTCTLSEADTWAMDDLHTLAEQVMGCVKVTVNEHQVAACLSLAYNIGIGRFRESSVLEALNLALYQRAADRFLEYDEAGGDVLQGLETRRAKERALFLASSPVTAPHPAPTPAPAPHPTPHLTPAPQSEADRLNEQEIAKLNDENEPLPPAA
jgi:lysozyme